MAKSLRSDLAEYLETGKKSLMEITNHYNDIRMSKTINVVKEIFDMVNKGEIIKIMENGKHYYEIANKPSKIP